jgi:dTDP-4-dehydrorhamnose reductase
VDLAATIRQIKPAIIVNAAAYTAVDKAESETELAKTINADAVELPPMVQDYVATPNLPGHFCLIAVFSPGFILVVFFHPVAVSP